MRFYLLIGVLIFPLLLAPTAFAEPAAVILYTANSLGKYEPCPSCDEGESIGGLARRASVFRRYREETGGTGLFLLAGGNEFLPILPVDEPDKRETLFTAKAYGMLDYDIGCLTGEETERLDGNGDEYLGAWHTYGTEPYATTLKKGGIVLGVVVLPPAGAGGVGISEETSGAVAAAVKKLRDESDLVIGLSPWGEPLEKKWLEEHPDVFDVLFGSGFGAGSGLRRVDGSPTLWIRPEFNGWGVQVLTVEKLPETEQWILHEDEHFSFESIRLDDKVEEESAMAALLQWL